MRRGYLSKVYFLCASVGAYAVPVTSCSGSDEPLDPEASAPSAERVLVDAAVLGGSGGRAALGGSGGETGLGAAGLDSSLPLGGGGVRAATEGASGDAGTGGTSAGGATGSPGGGDGSGAAGLGTGGFVPIADACRQRVEGLRMRRAGYLGNDGSFEDDAWYDTELGEYCDAMVAADGALRCLPNTAHGEVTGEVAYRDAECTQPIAYDRRSPCARDQIGRSLTYAFQYAVGECSESQPNRIYEVGEPIGPLPEAYSLLGDGGCTAASTSVEFYELLGELPPERFVAVERAQVVGNRLQTIHRVFADGAVAHQSHFVDAAYDSTTSSYCAPERATDGALRCLPLALLQIAYADAQCTMPVVGDRSFECLAQKVPSPGPLVFYPRELNSSRACDAASRVHEPTTESSLELQTVFQLSSVSGSCAEANTTPGTFLPVGAELSPETFTSGWAELFECGSKGRGGSRLQVLNTVWEDGYRDWYGFYDTELGEVCTRRTAADGVERCLPTLYAVSSNTYADSECTREAASLRDCPLDGAGADYATGAFAFKEVNVDDPCRDSALGAEVYSLVGSELSESFQMDLDGTCAPASNPDPPYRELGEQLPPSAFVAFARALAGSR